MGGCRGHLVEVGRLAQGALAEARNFSGAISSGVERHVDIVEVGGSRPPSPTRPDKFLIFLEKQALSRLFLAIRLYRIAFPHLQRRVLAPDTDADLIFAGGIRDRSYQARTA